jgi:hypothetical protein
VVHDFVHDVALVRAVDEGVQVLKQDRPYFESDHILNLALQRVVRWQPECWTT